MAGKDREMNAYVPTSRLRINARDEDWWQGNTTDTLIHVANNTPRYGRPEIYLPYEEGDPWWMPQGGWRLPWSFEIKGDGNNEAWGLRYWADPAVPDLAGTKDSHGIIMETWGCYIHDLCISNDRGPVEKGIGNGISVDYSKLPSRTGGDIQIERVRVLYSGNCGLELAPGEISLGNPGFVLLTDVTDSVIYGCSGHGVNIERASTTLKMRQVNVINNRGIGWRVIGCATSSFEVVSERNGAGLAAADPEACAFYMRDCEAIKLKLHVEEHTEDDGRGKVRDGLILDSCNAITVESSMIAGTWNPNTKGWNGTRLRNRTKNCVIMPQRCTSYAANSVIGDSTVQGNTIFKQERPVSGFDWKKNTRLWS